MDRSARSHPAGRPASHLRAGQGNGRRLQHQRPDGEPRPAGRLRRMGRERRGRLDLANVLPYFRKMERDLDSPARSTALTVRSRSGGSRAPSGPAFPMRSRRPSRPPACPGLTTRTPVRSSPPVSRSRSTTRRIAASRPPSRTSTRDAAQRANLTIHARTRVRRLLLDGKRVHRRRGRLARRSGTFGARSDPRLPGRSTPRRCCCAPGSARPSSCRNSVSRSSRTARASARTCTITR